MPLPLLVLAAARRASGAALRGLGGGSSSSKDDGSGYDYTNLVLLALGAALLALCCAGKEGGAVRGAVGSTLRRVTVRNTVEPAPQRSSSSSSKELAPRASQVAAASTSNKAGQVGKIVLGQYPPTREVDKLFAPQWVGPDRKPEDSERARDSQQSKQFHPTRARESKPKRGDEEPLEEKDDLSDDGERVEPASEAAAPKPDRDGAP
jgi:hypothetical protein